jgi:hypothetical protein
MSSKEVCRRHSFWPACLETDRHCVAVLFTGVCIFIILFGMSGWAAADNSSSEQEAHAFVADGAASHCWLIDVSSTVTVCGGGSGSGAGEVCLAVRGVYTYHVSESGLWLNATLPFEGYNTIKYYPLVLSPDLAPTCNGDGCWSLALALADARIKQGVGPVGQDATDHGLMHPSMDRRDSRSSTRALSTATGSTTTSYQCSYRRNNPFDVRVFTALSAWPDAASKARSNKIGYTIGAVLGAVIGIPLLVMFVARCCNDFVREPYPCECHKLNSLPAVPATPASRTLVASTVNRGEDIAVAPDPASALGDLRQPPFEVAGVTFHSATGSDGSEYGSVDSATAGSPSPASPSSIVLHIRAKPTSC